MIVMAEGLGKAVEIGCDDGRIVVIRGLPYALRECGDEFYECKLILLLHKASIHLVYCNPLLFRFSENGGDTGTVYTAGTLDEILKIYDKSSQYELDTGHVKAIVFGSGLLEQEDKMKEVLRWLEADRDLGRNALIFQTEQPSAIMEKRAELGDSVGVFLTGMYENREGRARKELTLDDVFYRWNNYGELPEIPRILPSEKGLILV